VIVIKRVTIYLPRGQVILTRWTDRDVPETCFRGLSD